jgi:hypothetical protein
MSQGRIVVTADEIIVYDGNPDGFDAECDFLVKHNKVFSFTKMDNLNDLLFVVKHHSGKKILYR